MSIPGSGRHRRGQVALEYLVMIGFGLMIATPLIIQGQESLRSLNQVDQSSKVTGVLDAAQETAGLVYSQGPPARASTVVTVPRGVVGSRVDGTLLSYTLSVEGGNASYFRDVGFTVNGSLPRSPGRYLLIAEATQSYVNITYR